jgi:hypothetical protein
MERKELDLDLELEKIAKKLQPMVKADETDYNSNGQSCDTSGPCSSE